MKKWILPLVALLILSGCNNFPVYKQNGLEQLIVQRETIQEQFVDLEVIQLDDDYEITVVFPFKAYEEYIRIVNKQGSQDESSQLKDIFQETVIDNIATYCFLTKPNSIHYDHYINNPPPLKGDLLKTYLKELDKEAILMMIAKGLTESRDLLKGPKKGNVCVLPAPTFSYSSGIAKGERNMILFYRNINDLDSLFDVITHEYHHNALANLAPTHNYITLLEQLIIEGKATYFESLLNQESVLNGGEEYENHELVKVVLENLDSYSSEFNEKVLFGDDERFPPNYGYYLGYTIVKEYVEKHPQLSIEEWTKADPEEILENTEDWKHSY
ncbi:DUF2268 domain-containing putative Zn-dependent protease [Bacillus kwashiorkori]|uniref:DUF2268 domain-containing putative Zn-dependent protease n=1 Tax=Bacillus kwashiorkori TaxID=1522318 RepID=UPI000782BEEC|nr:DUF2268 domain-containing putative Zn-dependent protease [Bacillus kwashiorkori]